MPLTLEIITPEGTSLTTSTIAVTFPSATGQLTILPGHQPIIGQTVAGELSYRHTDSTDSKTFAIDNGFFRLHGDKLSMLVEGAADSATIDLAAIENAQKRAQKALANSQKMDPAEVEELERIVRFSMAQRLVKQKR